MTEASFWGQPFTAPFEILDSMRRTQGDVLETLGFGAAECEHEVTASGPLWRLRRYHHSGSGPHVLIVPAPIKRPYIWDLAPTASAVRYCLAKDLGVHLLEWVPPTRENGTHGLPEYADIALSDAMTALSEDTGVSRPFVMGHSLGGTLAAIFAGLHPQRLAGLVLLSSALCLQPGVSGFRDSLSMLAPPSLHGIDIVPGSLLTQLSAMASPTTFVWSRLIDVAASVGNPRASDLRRRIERWALDEVPLSGKLVQDIFIQLYRENRLCRGTLEIGTRVVGPSSLRCPVLAVANPTDDIAPPASATPFLEAMSETDTHLIEYPGEAGVVLQHLGILVGRQALDRIWPEIISWMKARAR